MKRLVSLYRAYSWRERLVWGMADFALALAVIFFLAALAGILQGMLRPVPVVW